MRWEWDEVRVGVDRICLMGDKVAVEEKEVRKVQHPWHLWQRHLSNCIMSARDYPKTTDFGDFGT
jgi:hypothetical protein